MFDKTKEPTNVGVGSNSRNTSLFGERTQQVELFIFGSANNESQSTGTFGATMKNNTNCFESNGNFKISFKFPQSSEQFPKNTKATFGNNNNNQRRCSKCGGTNAVRINFSRNSKQFPKSTNATFGNNNNNLRRCLRCGVTNAVATDDDLPPFSRRFGEITWLYFGCDDKFIGFDQRKSTTKLAFGDKNISIYRKLFGSPQETPAKPSSGISDFFNIFGSLSSNSNRDFNRSANNTSYKQTTNTLFGQDGTSSSTSGFTNVFGAERNSASTKAPDGYTSADLFGQPKNQPLTFTSAKPSATKASKNQHDSTAEIPRPMAGFGELQQSNSFGSTTTLSSTQNCVDQNASNRPQKQTTNSSTNSFKPLQKPLVTDSASRIPPEENTSADLFGQPKNQPLTFSSAKPSATTASKNQHDSTAESPRPMAGFGELQQSDSLGSATTLSSTQNCVDQNANNRLQKQTTKSSTNSFKPLQKPLVTDSASRIPPEENTSADLFGQPKNQPLTFSSAKPSATKASENQHDSTAENPRLMAGFGELQQSNSFGSTTTLSSTQNCVDQNANNRPQKQTTKSSANSFKSLQKPLVTDSASRIPPEENTSADLFGQPKNQPLTFSSAKPSATTASKNQHDSTAESPRPMAGFGELQQSNSFGSTTTLSSTQNCVDQNANNRPQKQTTKSSANSFKSLQKPLVTDSASRIPPEENTSADLFGQPKNQPLTFSSAKPSATTASKNQHDSTAESPRPMAGFGELQQSNSFGSTTTLSSTQNCVDQNANNRPQKQTTKSSANSFRIPPEENNSADLFGQPKNQPFTFSSAKPSATTASKTLAGFGSTTTTSNLFGCCGSSQNRKFYQTTDHRPEKQATISLFGQTRASSSSSGLKSVGTNSTSRGPSADNIPAKLNSSASNNLSANNVKDSETTNASIKPTNSTSVSQTPAATKNEKSAASSELYGGASTSNNVSQMPLPTDNGTETQIKSDTQRNTEAAKTCSQASLVPNNNTSDIETNTGKTSNSTVGVDGSTSENEALRNISHIPFLNSARATGVTSKSPKENVIATNNANNYSDSESANSTTIPQNEVDATELSFSMLHIPPFSIENPEEWFTYVESQFAAASIVGDFMKYRTVLNGIKNNSLLKISDAEIPPPNNTSDKYGQLKRKILLKCNRQNLTIKALKNLELGKMTPTQLLNKMRIMGGIDINDDIIKPIWMNCLPFEVQNIISISSDDLSTLAVMADKIMALIRGISHTSTFALMSSEPRTYPHSSLELQISLLTKEIADLKMKVAERPAQ